MDNIRRPCFQCNTLAGGTYPETNTDINTVTHENANTDRDTITDTN